MCKILYKERKIVSTPTTCCNRLETVHQPKLAYMFTCICMLANDATYQLDYKVVFAVGKLEWYYVVLVFEEDKEMRCSFTYLQKFDEIDLVCAVCRFIQTWRLLLLLAASDVVYEFFVSAQACACIWKKRKKKNPHLRTQIHTFEHFEEVLFHRILRLTLIFPHSFAQSVSIFPSLSHALNHSPVFPFVVHWERSFNKHTTHDRLVPLSIL